MVAPHKRLILFHLVLALALAGCDSSSSELEKRKQLAVPVLSISNGTDGDRAMRLAATKAIEGLAVSDNSSIEAIAFRILPGRGRYIVAAYWVGLEQQADGIQIEFSDGTKMLTPFHKDDSGSNQDSLFFSAMAFSERLPEPFNANRPDAVSTVTLTKAGEICSNTIRVTVPRDDSTIWKDVVGANINDDLELWGFAE